MQKIESAAAAIKAAANWEKKGQLAWVVRCLSTPLMNYLSLAVERYDDLASMRSWLQEQGVTDILAKYVHNLEMVASEVRSGKSPGAVLGGNYSHLVFAHMGSLLGVARQASFLGSVAVEEVVMEASTPFWNQYALTLDAWQRGSKPAPHLGAVGGIEKYWTAYVAFMTAAANGEPLTPHIADIDRQFRERNADISITDDSYEIEGSGRHRVKLDFRKEALLALYAAKAGRQ